MTYEQTIEKMVLASANVIRKREGLRPISSLDVLDQNMRAKLLEEMEAAYRVAESAGITAGGFSLKQGSSPGKIMLTSPSGQVSEVDGKVLEDVLASLF